MKAKELQLANQYIEYERKLADVNDNMRATLEELKTLAPHKIGEVITYKKADPMAQWVPIMRHLPKDEYKAVLINVDVKVWQWGQMKEPNIMYQYSFSPIKNDGSISKHKCYPSNYKWTGETYELKKK